MSEEYILQVKDLRTSFFTDSGEVKAVNGVTFNLAPGKILGIVGESGSGKSVTAYSIMQILASTGRIVGGEVLYRGQDITKFDKKQMKNFRGKCCSIIFQDPMTSLNPVFTIGNQLMEAILLHTDKNKAQAKERAIEMLELVGVNEPAKQFYRRIGNYYYEIFEDGSINKLSAETGATLGLTIGNMNDIFKKLGINPKANTKKSLLEKFETTTNALPKGLVEVQSTIDDIF